MRQYGLSRLRFTRRARLFAAGLTAPLAAACGGGSDAPSGPAPQDDSPPPALESIPYEQLWAGTLVFKRLDPAVPSGYTAVYVLDAAARTSAGMFEKELLYAPAVTPRPPGGGAGGDATRGTRGRRAA